MPTIVKSIEVNVRSGLPMTNEQWNAVIAEQLPDWPEEGVG